MFACFYALGYFNYAKTAHVFPEDVKAKLVNHTWRSRNFCVKSQQEIRRSFVRHMFQNDHNATSDPIDQNKWWVYTWTQINLPYHSKID